MNSPSLASFGIFMYIPSTCVPLGERSHWVSNGRLSLAQRTALRALGTAAIPVWLRRKANGEAARTPIAVCGSIPSNVSRMLSRQCTIGRDAYTFCWHFIWQWFNTSFLILLFSTGCIPKWEEKDGKMMQNMRQVAEIFLCYGSVHKQPPLTAAGKCRITRFKTRKGGTQSLCRDQCIQLSWDKNVLSDCKWASAQTRGCRGPVIMYKIAVFMHV